jgi:hypothetical protein
MYAVKNGIPGLPCVHAMPSGGESMPCSLAGWGSWWFRGGGSGRGVNPAGTYSISAIWRLWGLYGPLFDSKCHPVGVV